MRLVTAPEMQAIDRAAIENVGIPGLVLMENAGIKALFTLEKLVGPLPRQRFTIVCGKGNNGGDGLVIARHLCNHQVPVHVFLALGADDLATDAATNLAILRASGYEPIVMRGAEDLDRLRVAMEFSTVVIDAVFGTGFSGEITGYPAEVIRVLNSGRGMRVAIDVPSGVDATTGRVSACAFEANCTITLGLPKLGLYLFPARSHAGEIWVADIGLPATALTAVPSGQTLLNRELTASLLPVRSDDSHKGTWGHALVLAGSDRYRGAAVLSTYGALRVGTGLVTLGVPEPLLGHAWPGLLPEVITRGFTAEAGGFAVTSPEIQHLAGNATAIAAGMGWGRGPGCGATVRRLLAEWPGALLLDADALNAIDDPTCLRQHAGPLVLTPHLGEMARLLDLPVADVRADLVGVGRRFVARHPCVLVLKCATTVIVNRDGHCLVCPQANSGLARGGAGDLLSGMIVGFLAQGLGELAAALLGVMIHAEAGEIAREDLGTTAMTITEVAACIPRAIRRIQGDETRPSG